MQLFTVMFSASEKAGIPAYVFVVDLLLSQPCQSRRQARADLCLGAGEVRMLQRGSQEGWVVHRAACKSSNGTPGISDYPRGGQWAHGQAEEVVSEAAF